MWIANVISTSGPLRGPDFKAPTGLTLRATMGVTWDQFIKMNRVGLKYSGPKDKNAMWLPARVKKYTECELRPWDKMPSRKRANIAAMTAFVFDIDNKASAVTTDQFLRWWPCKVMLGSTANSSVMIPRFRAVAPIAREVSPDEYRTIIHVLAGRAKVARIVLDESSRDPERPYYWCQTSVTGHGFVEDRDGDVFDPDVFMKTVRDSELPAKRVEFDKSKLPPVDTSDDNFERVKAAVDGIIPTNNTYDRNDVWMVCAALKAFGDRGFPVFEAWFNKVKHSNSTASKEWARCQPAVSLGMVINRSRWRTRADYDKRPR